MVQQKAPIKRKSRQGKIQIGVWVDEDLYREFQHLAIEEKTSIGLTVENAMRSYLYQRRQK